MSTFARCQAVCLIAGTALAEAVQRNNQANQRLQTLAHRSQHPPDSSPIVLKTGQSTAIFSADLDVRSDRRHAPRSLKCEKRFHRARRRSRLYASTLSGSDSRSRASGYACGFRYLRASESDAANTPSLSV